MTENLELNGQVALTVLRQTWILPALWACAATVWMSLCTALKIPA